MLSTALRQSSRYVMQAKAGVYIVDMEWEEACMEAWLMHSCAKHCIPMGYFVPPCHRQLPMSVGCRLKIAERQQRFALCLLVMRQD